MFTFVVFIKSLPEKWLKKKKERKKERKVMTNSDSILKSRNMTLPTKVHVVKAMFSTSHVWM